VITSGKENYFKVELKLQIANLEELETAFNDWEVFDNTRFKMVPTLQRI